MPQETSIYATPSRISVGEGDTPTVTVYLPDKKVLGSKYGHTLRLSSRELGRIDIVLDPNAKKLDSELWVISGGDIATCKDILTTEKRILLLNPGDAAVDVLDASYENINLEVFVGELAHWQQVSVWKRIAQDYKNIRLETLPGVADYVPDWARYLSNNRYDIASEEDNGVIDSDDFDPFH